jgi:hypothetical protein
MLESGVATRAGELAEVPAATATADAAGSDEYDDGDLMHMSDDMLARLQRELSQKLGAVGEEIHRRRQAAIEHQVCASPARTTYSHTPSMRETRFRTQSLCPAAEYDGI